MIAIGLDWLVILYLTGGLGLIFGLWFLYDFREKRMLQARTQSTVFHCVKCGHLFSVAKQSEREACPKCGFNNSRLGF